MNILLVSHGMLCEGVLSAFTMLMGPSERVHTCGLTEAGVDDFRARLTAQAEELLAQGDLLILSDLKGGTPYNEGYALYLAHPERVRLAAGLNLPMLLTCAIEAMASDDLDALYATALAEGSQGVAGAELPAPDASDEDEDLF